MRIERRGKKKGCGGYGNDGPFTVLTETLKPLKIQIFFSRSVNLDERRDYYGL
jgi:hypothetical protein